MFIYGLGYQKVNKQKYYGSGDNKQMLPHGGAKTVPCLHLIIYGLVYQQADLTVSPNKNSDLEASSSTVIIQKIDWQ